MGVFSCTPTLRRRIPARPGEAKRRRSRMLRANGVCAIVLVGVRHVVLMLIRYLLSNGKREKNKNFSKAYHKMSIDMKLY